MTGVVWSASRKQVVQAAQAVVPFAVPGVLYGESLFETLRVTDGQLFQLERHLDRLERSIHQLGWPQVAREVVTEGLVTLLRDHRMQEADLRVRITVLSMGEGQPPECLIYAAPYTPPPPSVYDQGVAAAITSVRVDEAALWTRVKSGNRMAYQMARRQAQQSGAWEGLLLNTQGRLADGSITNLHFVVGGTLCTPSVASGALPGITRAVVEQSANEKGVPLLAGAYAPQALYEASEAFLTNAVVGVVPLVQVDGRVIGSGRPGPLTKALIESYRQRRNMEAVTAERYSM